MESKGLLTKIGIIGGGQLSKMLLLEAKKLGFATAVLDPDEHCPARIIADKHIQAPLDAPDALRALADCCDVLTYEESASIDSGALLAPEAEGVRIYPSAKSLSLVRDRWTQKQTLRSGGVPVPDFVSVSDMPELRAAAAAFGYPFLLKSRVGGRDKRENYVLRGEKEMETGYAALGGGETLLMAERIVPFLMEAAVLACRGADGSIAVYPVGQCLYENNLLLETRVPAQLTQKTRERAIAVAERVVKLFDGVGVFCVKLFVQADGGVLVNDVTPHPHDAGLYSTEGCVTGQLEQHVRAVMELPLGDASLIRPAVTRALPGIPGTGCVAVEGRAQALAVSGVKLYIYGNRDTSPRQKTGYLSVTADTVEKAAMLAESAWRKVRIVPAKE